MNTVMLCHHMGLDSPSIFSISMFLGAINKILQIYNLIFDVLSHQAPHNLPIASPSSKTLSDQVQVVRELSPFVRQIST